MQSENFLNFLVAVVNYRKLICVNKDIKSFFNALENKYDVVCVLITWTSGMPQGAIFRNILLWYEGQTSFNWKMQKQPKRTN